MTYLDGSDGSKPCFSYKQTCRMLVQEMGPEANTGMITLMSTDVTWDYFNLFIIPYSLYAFVILIQNINWCTVHNSIK